MNKAIQFWDSTAAKYDAQLKQFEKSYAKTREKICFYVKKSDTVLDFGCGTGHVTLQFAPMVSEVEAVDTSYGMLSVAKDKLQKIDLTNTVFHQASVFEQSLKRESFDVVVAINVFHLIKKRESVIKRLYSLLKPGGLLLSTTVCSGENTSFFNGLLWFFSRAGIIPYMDFIKSDVLENQIVSSGFDIIEKERLTENAPNYFIAAKKN